MKTSPEHTKAEILKSHPQWPRCRSLLLAGAVWCIATSLALLLAASASPAPSATAATDASGDIKKPKVPPLLCVPPGHKAALHAYGIGVQIYVWTVNETNAAQSAWVLRAPSAALFDEDGMFIGYHYKGPTWESRGGFSQVEGVVRQRCPAVASNAVPWLLLQGTNASGTGTFDRTTYIQRVNTTGGLPPTAPGTEAGQRSRSPYTSEYYFYRAAK